MAGSTYVADLAEGAVVDATFAVQRKTRRRTRNGDPFLSVELADRTGRVPGVVWNDVNLLGARFDQGDTVRVLGKVEAYAGRLQISVRDLERIEGGDPLELVPGSRRDAETLEGFLEFLAGEIHHEGLRAVVSRRDRRPARPRAAPHRAGVRDAPRLRRRPARAHRRRRHALPRGGAAPPAPQLRHPARGRAPARRRPHRDLPARRDDRRLGRGPDARPRPRRGAHDRRRGARRRASPTTSCSRS